MSACLSAAGHGHSDAVHALLSQESGLLLQDERKVKLQQIIQRMNNGEDCNGLNAEIILELLPID